MLRLQECHDTAGILLVTSSPTSPQYVEEIEEWYDTEHGPARLKLGEEYFSNGRRFRLRGDDTSWLAIYDMRDLSSAMRESYTSLRTNRSLREREIFRAKLEVRSRQFLKLLAEKGSMSRSSDVMYVVRIETGDDVQQVERWYQDIIFNIFTEVGCLRSRLFQLVEGTCAEEGRTFFVGIHDFERVSDHLESVRRMRVATTIHEQERIIRCSKMQVFTLENEFSVSDYRAP